MNLSIRRTMFFTVTMAIAPALGIGCANDTTPPPTGGASEAPGAGAESLELTRRTQTDVAGTYHSGSVTVGFDAARSDAGFHWALYLGDGKEMFRVEQVGDSVVTTVLGAYHERIDGNVVAKLKAGTLDQAAVLAGISVDGDRALFDSMRALPEYAVLPGLSRALGSRGITGQAYPCTLALHLLAAQVDRDQKQGAPPPPTAGASSKNLEGFPPGTPLPQCYLSGNQTCCRLNASQPYNCFLTPKPLTCTDIYPPPDMRCDPNHDDCFGMCGPGCTCWDWVCGDCNYHAVCAQHDWFCGQVENASWYDWLINPALPFYASQCAGGVSALVAAFGCDF